MAATITFRPDEDTARALEILTRDGTPVSAAVRSALLAAARERARATLREEAERLAARIHRGHLARDPLADKCPRHCDFHPICRRERGEKNPSENGAPAEDEDD